LLKSLWVFLALALPVASTASPSVAAGSTVTAAGAAGPEYLLAAVCYHRFGVETKKDPYRISLARLAAQLDWLRADGWRSVSLTQVAAALDGDTRALPPKGVLLSVDDGYKAGALAAPVFERHGFRAVYFVVPSVLGDGAFLSYQDLHGLEARGFEVASHTLTHPDLAKVPKGMDPAAYVRWVDHELVESKRLLERGLGHPVGALAWPYGAYNPSVAAAAKRAGYRQLWSVSGGVNSTRSMDRLRLRRILLMGHPPLATFQQRVSSKPLPFAVDGISEGALVYRSELPLRIGVPRGLRAALGGIPLALDPDGSVTIGVGLKNGFHYLNLAEEDGAGRLETPYLFQIAPDAWRPYFEALASGPKL
jgi:peptidoglycan/xylan/chitin deacetylase (PgdA/CDA1 family)